MVECPIHLCSPNRSLSSTASPPPPSRRRPVHGYQHVRPAQRATRPPLRRAFIRGFFLVHVLGNGRRQGFRRVDALWRASPAAGELGGDDSAVRTELGIVWEWWRVIGGAENLGVDTNGMIGRWAKGEEEATLEMGLFVYFKPMFNVLAHKDLTPCPFLF